VVFATILLDCLPMGGIGSLYSNPSLEYRQPPEREAKTMVGRYFWRVDISL